jgi:hypothetical protein
MTTMPCARCGQRPVADPGAGPIGEAARLAIMCADCAADGPLTPEEAVRYRDRLEEERDAWPIHQPECFDAPIPGRQWYGGCEPGGDWDSETNGYEGTGPRVDPSTGRCESCGEQACPECGRQNCPDHTPAAAPA